MRASVSQAIRVGAARDLDATYSQAVWVGTVGGSALPTDPSPNTTPPAANRIIRVSPLKGVRVRSGTAGPRFMCPPVASASITIQPWFYDDTQAQWIQLGPPMSLTPTSTATQNFNGIAVNNTTYGMSGAKLFLQITANSNTQALGYDFA
jgi:hypothetical protein